LIVGIGFALLCAAVTQLGFLCKHRGAAGAPSVDLTKPLQSAKALFKERWFAIGWIVGLGAFGLHVAAMALAPLSVVQVTLSSGVIMLAVMGQCCFGQDVSLRTWVGVLMTAVGLTALVLTLPASAHHVGYATPVLIAFLTAVLAIGVLLIAAPKLGTPDHHHGALLGGAAGMLFGMGDVAIKALTTVDGPLAVLTSPWLPAAILASVLAFFASARGFQEGDAVPVIACTSTAANITVITGGIVVFGDALAGGVLLAVQLAAFALVAVSALVTPAGHASPASA